ncbi:MAG TPA: UDP-N-acetylglucosamine 1-carboxyvinyltransferase, partial [Bacillota bacterium]|nr:UDP-N-acetylglucosamine 1-carboxyvinyltransferase [Bacillota bacterium]
MEEKLIIKGNKKLQGEVCISGAKNSAVGIIPAALLSDSGCIIKNLPDIEDVRYLKELLLQVGAKANDGNTGELEIISKGMKNHRVNFEIAKKMRASYYFLGA